MSTDQTNLPPQRDPGKDGEPGDAESGRAPGTANGEPDAGETTGAEKAASNREEDPPA